MLTNEELVALYESLDDQGKERLSERAQVISERSAQRAERLSE